MRPRVRRGFASQRRQSPAGRVSTLALPELIDLRRQLGLDLAGSLRERFDQFAGNAGDLGLTIDDLLPGDAVAMRQLGAEHRLVQPAKHALVPLEVAGVERHPSAFLGLDLGRDHGVGVQLRVVSTRRRLLERGHGQPERVGMLAMTVHTNPSRRPEPLQVLERCSHGDVVRFEQAGIAGEGPPDAERLGGGECGIEPGHRPYHPAVGQRPVDEWGTQGRTT